MRYIIASALVLLALIASPGAIEAKSKRTVMVSGKSELTIEAQSAVINIQVRTESKSLAQSHELLVNALDKMTQDLVSEGMEREDVKRALIDQGDVFKWIKNTQVHDGYYSSSSVELHIDSIKKIAGIYKALSKHKAVSIWNTLFERNDEYELRTAEYKKALLIAKEKAAMMAETLGARLGKVHSINEISTQGGFFEQKLLTNRAAEAPAAPVASYGSITISAAVIVEFELK